MWRTQRVPVPRRVHAAGGSGGAQRVHAAAEGRPRCPPRGRAWNGKPDAGPERAAPLAGSWLFDLPLRTRRSSHRQMRSGRHQTPFWGIWNPHSSRKSDLPRPRPLQRLATSGPHLPFLSLRPEAGALVSHQWKVIERPRIGGLGKMGH